MITAAAMTLTDLRMRVSAGRAVVNYALAYKLFDIFTGANTNLNFPPKAASIKIIDCELDYRYSSAVIRNTYLNRRRCVQKPPRMKLMPSAEEKQSGKPALNSLIRNAGARMSRLPAASLPPLYSLAASRSGNTGSIRRTCEM